MKKALYGTTALLAAGMLSLPAMALHEDDDGNLTPHTGNLSLSINGDASFKIEYKSRETDKDDTISYRNHNADFDSELHFEGQTTLDNGTTAGLEIQIETGGSELGTGAAGTAKDIIDENFIWVEGSLGKVYLGGRDADELETGIPDVYDDVGLLKGDMNGNEVKALKDTADIASQYNKIIYRTPSMGGLEIAINYTPAFVQNTTTNETNKDVGEKGEDLLVGLQWSGAVGGAAVEISLGYGNAAAEDPAVDKDIKSEKRQRIGFEVSGIGNLTIGGFWLKTNDNAVTTVPSEDRVDQGLGVAWESGAWEVGAAWQSAKQDELTDAAVNVKTGTDKGVRTEVGVVYQLNDDMKLKVGYRQEKFEDDVDLAADENNTKSFDVQFQWDVGPGLEFDVGLQNFRYTHHDGLAVATKKTGTAAFVTTKVSF